MAEVLTAESARRKFTVEEYFRMISAEIIDEEDRVELIEGDVLLMNPEDPAHAGAAAKLNILLGHAYREGHTVRVQLPLIASRHSLPQPDFAVVRGGPEQYGSRTPSGADAVLVVEIASGSDRMSRRKVDIYAAAAIPVYFRVDLPRRRVEVYEQPDRLGSYTLMRVLDESAEVVLPGAPCIRVRDFLPVL